MEGMRRSIPSCATGAAKATVQSVIVRRVAFIVSKGSGGFVQECKVTLTTGFGRYEEQKGGSVMAKYLE